MTRAQRTLVIGAAAILLGGIGVVAFFLRSTEVPLEIPAPVVEEVTVSAKTIGTSVEGRAIEAFTYGTGERHVVFVGGIHGGYEWNSILLAYTLMDSISATPAMLPEGVKVTIIPNANPDGTFAIVQKEGRFQSVDVPPGDRSSGRFNANGVDLNRNFACKWQPSASWRGNVVGAGTAAFSEPEAVALRDFFMKEMPDAAVFFHSQAGAVYASECTAGVLPETLAAMNVYATAAGYQAVPAFDAYPITGDIEGWLASISIPAITVELTSHESMEWEKNRAGIEALLKHVSTKE